jgi:hypothetical protein
VKESNNSGFYIIGSPAEIFLPKIVCDRHQFNIICRRLIFRRINVNLWNEYRKNTGADGLNQTSKKGIP